MYGCCGLPNTFAVVAHLDDHAAPQDHGAVADVVAEREVVSDEEDPEPARLQVAQQVQDVDARRRIEHADDLVGDEELDVEQERPRDEQALELAAAQLVRVLVQHLARVERHRLERRLELVPPLAAADLREVGVLDQLEDAIGLVDRVVRAEWILEDALGVPVVLLQALPLERGDVLVP